MNMWSRNCWARCEGYILAHSVTFWHIRHVSGLYGHKYYKLSTIQE